MPGPVSDPYQGPSDDSPYVPSWCYARGPRMCPCGHHEGYHNDAGACLLAGRSCRCAGIPAECVTPLEEMTQRDLDDVTPLPPPPPAELRAARPTMAARSRAKRRR